MIIQYHLDNKFEVDMWHCVGSRGHKFYMPTEIVYSKNGDIIFHRICVNCGFSYHGYRSKQKGCCGDSKNSIRWEPDKEATDWVMEKNGIPH